MMLKFSSLIRLTLSLVVLVSRCHALNTWNVTSNNFVRMLWTSSIVVGNWLYIDGGEFYQPGAASFSDLIHLNGTLSIDLSASWSTSNLIINSFPKPQLNVRNGALWYNPASSTILSFGGEPYDESALSLSSTWSLSPDGHGAGTWSQTSFSTDAVFPTLVRPEYGLLAASETTGYSLGGMQTAFPSDIFWAIPGLITYSFATPKWNNLTSAGKYSASGMALHGAAQFVPGFGVDGKGVVAMLGGVVPSSSWDTYGSLRSMTNVTVYDTGTGEWYSQTATGDVPSPRKNLCVIGVQSGNKSTYEIYIYGGWNGAFDSTANTDSNSVYILLLPAFHWVRTTSTAPSRAGSNCLLVGNRQMISIGGWDPTSTAEFATADPWTFGIGVFDLTALSWGSGYDANAKAYEKPDVVTSYYATQLVSPFLSFLFFLKYVNWECGERLLMVDSNLFPTWDNPSLASLFASSTTNSTSNSTSSPTSSSSPSNTPNQANRDVTIGTPIWRVVVPIIGGIVAFTLLVFAIWWLIRRKRKRRIGSGKGVGEGGERRKGRRAELDSTGKPVAEMGPERAWEMHGGGKPVEMDSEGKLVEMDGSEKVRIPRKAVGVGIVEAPG